MNVLKRFRDFIKILKNDIIVRVTADNPFVDKNFLIRLIKIYKFKNLEYLHMIILKIYPKGYKLKFKVKHLREIKTNKIFVKEHVTPLIKKSI